MYTTIEKCVDDLEYSIIQGPYGLHRVKMCHFNNGSIPSIQTSLDKNLHFTNQAKEIHGDIYDYSKVDYINATTKVVIVCKLHGDFKVTPNQHLSKNRKTGCQKCSKILRGLKRRNTLEYFINKSNLKHRNKYDYSKSNYIRQNTPVVITCPIHGEFLQNPKEHIRGSGCYECGKNNISKARREFPTGWRYNSWIKISKTSKEFDSYKVYVILCKDDKEEFIKIGRTYKKTNRRFRSKNFLPYKYKILYEVIDDAIEVCKKEKLLSEMCKNFKYIPTKNFKGMFECFTVKALDVVEDYFKQISAIPR